MKKTKLKNLVISLLRNHILIRTSVVFLILGKSYNSLLLLRNVIENLVYKRLNRKYRNKAANYYNYMNKKKYCHQKSDIIWFCWFQGIENAPLIVKACYRSIVKNFSNKKVIVITSTNYTQYVNIPDFILNKYKDGYINKTTFSDILRLELLIKYGGLWIDATVFCTGNKLISQINNSNLFMYQILKPGFDGHTIRFSSWLIYSKSNNEVLILTRYLMYEYFSSNKKLITYFLLHNFLEIAVSFYQEEYKNILPASSEAPHEMLFKLFCRFDKSEYDFICSQSDFHKLTYKFNNEETFKDRTFYHHIINLNK